MPAAALPGFAPRSLTKSLSRSDGNTTVSKARKPPRKEDFLSPETAAMRCCVHDLQSADITACGCTTVRTEVGAVRQEILLFHISFLLLFSHFFALPHSESKWIPLPGLFFLISLPRDALRGRLSPSLIAARALYERAALDGGNGFEVARHSSAR